MLLAVSCAPLHTSRSGQVATDLICCGWDEVFIIRSVNDTTRKWTWRASDSTAIPTEAHPWFQTTDECKPLGKFILITSSSGGVALVRRDDRHCSFYTYARNAHSACLLPDERIAVASSTGGDELLVFDLNHSGAEVEPLARMVLKGAHGAHWDSRRARLWALGSEELLLVQVKGTIAVTTLEVNRRWNLPTDSGHDLFPCRDPRFLFVTSGTHVYRFDTETGRFALDDALGETPRVKSVDQHAGTGSLVYHQATVEHWWSDTIRFAGSERTIALPGERLYKVRWDVPRMGPESP